MFGGLPRFGRAVGRHVYVALQYEIDVFWLQALCYYFESGYRGGEQLGSVSKQVPPTDSTSQFN